MKLAAFVKTPGASPIKTRLAAGLGAARAAEFYDLACSAVAAVMAAAAPEVTPHWAVAEAQVAARWSRFPALLQGPGDLGAKLHRVYHQLSSTSGSAGAAVIGADSPQITAALLRAARASLAQGADFVMGPAADGGFYLFAGRRPVPQSVWTGIKYSSPTTESELAAAVAPLGKLVRLGVLTDADEVADLAAVERELAAIPHAARLPEQDDLLYWLANVSSATRP